MDARTRLERNLASESEAYGYTPAVWGSGASLVDAYGVPGAGGVLSFVTGALAGFGGLAVVAFRELSGEATVEGSPSSLVVSMIHLVATGATVGLVSLVVNGSVTGSPWLFFAVGALVTVAYNLLLSLEEVAVRGLA